MSKKADALLARMNRAQETGGKAMWYMLFADAIADRLCEAETITRDEMREIFEKRLQEVRDSPESKLFVPGYEQCLQRLDEFQAKNIAENGYTPTGL